VREYVKSCTRSGRTSTTHGTPAQYSTLYYIQIVSNTMHKELEGELDVEPERYALNQSVRVRPSDTTYTEFLRGPIPLVWLQKAAKLRGKAPSLVMVLWYYVGLTNSWKVRPSSTVLKKFGIERRSGYRALTSLENAGLIEVERRRGARPLVTILSL